MMEKVFSVTPSCEEAGSRQSESGENVASLSICDDSDGTEALFPDLDEGDATTITITSGSEGDEEDDAAGRSPAIPKPAMKLLNQKVEEREVASPMPNLYGIGKDEWKHHAAVEPFTPANPTLLRRRRGHIRSSPHADEEAPAFIHSWATWVIGEELDWLPPTPPGWEQFIVKPEFRNRRRFPLREYRSPKSDELLIDAKLYVVGPASSTMSSSSGASDVSGAWRRHRMVIRTTDEDYLRILPKFFSTPEPFVKFEICTIDRAIIIKCDRNKDVRLLLKFGKDFKKRM